MTDTQERTRDVAFLFATWFFNLVGPHLEHNVALVYKGKAEVGEIDGNFFTTKNGNGADVTLFVDRKCRFLWMFTGIASAEQIADPKKRYGIWRHDEGKFTPSQETDVIFSEDSIRTY